jgi:hypothetical protein
MDKDYILETLRERIVKLRNNYKAAVINVDNLTYGSAAVARSKAKQQLGICLLLEELIVSIPGSMVALSDDAFDALERAIDPMEKHGRLKDVRL